MVKTSKKVSIVLPVYNGGVRVGQSIDSILSQTYTNFELILVNDCSTDNTLQIFEKYAKLDNRIIVINNPVNLKLPLSLNIGFENACGDYFSWTSDDNLYKKNAIEKMVTALEKNREFCMVYANYTAIDSAGRSIQDVFLQEPQCMAMGNVIGACFLYTKDIARKVGGYDPSLFLAEDYDYWIRILRTGKILHIPDNLYYYRCHPESLSETKKDIIGKQISKTLEKNFLFLYTSMETPKERHAFLDRFYMGLDGQDTDKVQIMINKIDSSYIAYKKRKEKKEKLRSTVLCKRLCRLKKGLRQKI